MRRRKERDLRATLSKPWAHGTEWKQMDWRCTEFLREFDYYRQSETQGKLSPLLLKSFNSPESPEHPWRGTGRKLRELYISQENIFPKAHFGCAQGGQRRAKPVTRTMNESSVPVQSDFTLLLGRGPLQGLLCRASEMLQTMDCCVCVLTLLCISICKFIAIILVHNRWRKRCVSFRDLGLWAGCSDWVGFVSLGEDGTVFYAKK